MKMARFGMHIGITITKSLKNRIGDLLRKLPNVTMSLQNGSVRPVEVIL